MCDYKGLDLNLIKPFSQLYPDSEDIAILIYDGELPIHMDIVEITETEYKNYKDSMNNSQNTESLNDRMAAVEIAIANMMGV